MASDQEETRATGEPSGPSEQGSITVSRTDLEQLIVTVVQREMASQQQRPGDSSASGAGGELAWFLRGPTGVARAQRLPVNYVWGCLGLYRTGHDALPLRARR